MDAMQRLLLGFVLVGLVSPSALADIRYRIRPRTGEILSMWQLTPDKEITIPACRDSEMQDRLWRTLFRLPTVTVHENGTIDIDLAVGQRALKAEEQTKYASGKLVAYWNSNTPGIFFGVSIKERAAFPPIIEVVVVREEPGKICGLKWVGLGDKY